mgnify:FL=1
MKRFFQKLANAFRSAVETVKTVLTRKVTQTRVALASAVGEGYVDSGVKIIIAVVVGGVLLAGLYALFKTTILPTLNTKITGMFGYTG